MLKTLTIRPLSLDKLVKSSLSISRNYTIGHFTPAPPLNTQDLNPRTIEAKYAVRGKIPQRAEELKKLIERNEDHNLPFNEIIFANIGNPQQLDQQPLTWYRQVLSILENPSINTENYPQDVVERAKVILKDVGSVGAYSNSQGSLLVRGSIANYINRRDGGSQANRNDIYLTSGASAAVQYLLQLLSVNERSGFLIPIPQYPLYTASIALNNAKPIGYFLDESNNWLTDPKQLRHLIQENKSKNIDLKALVVINPGNPTGSVLKEDDIKEIINIAAEFGIVIIADEVYQDNVYDGEFISFKKVLSSMIRQHPELYQHVQLASLHSTSKGLGGECGQRGGYMELVGFEPEVKSIILKLCSINLCSVVSGQALVELMVNPPHGDSLPLFKEQTSTIYNNLKERALTLHTAFNNMQDVTCNKPQGAMYLFPKLNFDKLTYPKLFSKAKNEDCEIDELYCIELLEATGICTVPGSGFGQVPNTYHLRTTFLPPGTDWIHRWEEFHKKFVATYKN